MERSIMVAAAAKFGGPEMRMTWWSIVILSLAVTTGVATAEATFIPVDRFDLTKVLAPAPAPGSDQQRRDLAEILAIQKSRTSAQSDRALADATAGIFAFADVLGPSFNAQQVPAVVAFLEKARGDAVVVVGAAKSVWNRQRPYVASSEVNPIGDRPQSSSYPSDASTVGYLTAILLADMVPERAASLYARGRELGDERTILSVHFPSDVEAGRLAATAFASALLQNATFISQLSEAKTQLRHALGL
jgi:acid phosphatase (class A)